MWCWGVARRAVDARGKERPFVEERQAHGRCKLLRLGRKTAHDSEVRDTRKSGNIINEHTSLTPRYAFTPHMLAAPPAMTNVVEILNALRECREPLKLSSFETRDGTSEGHRNKAPVVAGAVPGSVLVHFEAAMLVSQVVKSSEKVMYVCYVSNAADEEERGEGQEPQW